MPRIAKCLQTKDNINTVRHNRRNVRALPAVPVSTREDVGFVHELRCELWPWTVYEYPGYAYMLSSLTGYSVRTIYRMRQAKSRGIGSHALKALAAYARAKAGVLLDIATRMDALADAQIAAARAKVPYFKLAAYEERTGWRSVRKARR